jgi:hypothetical protein
LDDAACLPPLYVSKSLYRMENYEGILAHPANPQCGPLVQGEDLYLRGLSHLWLRQWPDAAREFADVPAGSALSSDAARAAKAAPKGADLPTKSPGLAAGLSVVVPGSGYLYANRPQTALAAFVVNGLFIAGTYGAAHQKEPGLAALLGLFSFGFYFGGVYGSAQAAQRETYNRLADFIQPLELGR